MSAGSMFLIIAAILVYCGLLQRVLDRMYLTDRQALLLIGAMLVGTYLPDFAFGSVRINVGGALIPLGVCVYLFIKSDELKEKWHMLLGTLLSAAGVYFVGTMMPAEAELMILDPLWLYGCLGGILAWLLGRSRRNAFVCGVAGVIIADFISGISAMIRGYQVQIVIGGGGIADATVISGVTGVLICEIIGEVLERVNRTKHNAERQNV